MSSCPTPETLCRLARESPGDPRFVGTEAHVQGCPHCQQVLEGLASEASASDLCGPGRPAGPGHAPTIPGFVIEGELGRGGMAVVYRAWQPQLARHVAIKVVGASPGIGPEDRRRWLREARAIGRVRHRNIVPIHEAGERDGCLYLVLDLIGGGSLAGRVAGPLPPRAAARLMVEIARAVDAIHRAGLLHLDIKPANILLDGPPDGPWDQVAPMLADFGIARAGDDPAATPGSIGVWGTPSFMAPEQLAGDGASIGPGSDVFALGASLYCLLTGRPPFRAASVIETLDLVRTREPAPPRALVPGLPRDLETIALSCLRKDPRRRYASAAAMADDLRRWLDGLPIRSRPISGLERAVRWCRHRPAPASLLAALAITVAISLGGLLALWRHSGAERTRAEIAQARAIASDRATSSTVRGLVDLLSTTVDSPQMLGTERLDEGSRSIRKLTAELRRGRPIDSADLVAICNLERRIAESLRTRIGIAESRALLADSLGLLEGRRGAAAPDVDEAYARTLLEILWCDLNQGRLDEAQAGVERAGEALEAWVGDPRRSEAIGLLDAAVRSVAARLGRQGLADRRRVLLEAHLRRLEHSADPAVGVFAALTRMELAGERGAIATLRAVLRRFPADRRLPVRVEAAAADWVAGGVDLDPSGPDAIGGPIRDCRPEAHAARVIRELDRRCEALGPYPNLLPAAAFQVAGRAAARGSEQRRADHLDDARRTAACLSAFARTMTRRDPDEATFHMLRCIAFEQESKNAWRTEDHAAIEPLLRQALGEAGIASRLDPHLIDARLSIAGIQDKLIRLNSTHAPSP